MNEHMTGTVSLVTGASSGIGEATARELAATGSSLVLVARREAELEALAASIRDAGGVASVVVADIAERDQAEAAVARTIAEHGRLDVVVNAAGVMLLGPAEDAPVEEWEKMVAINGLGLMYLSKAALPHLLEAAQSSARGVADIVNVSSLAGRQAIVGGSGYHFTKYGVVGFSEGLRREIGTRGVRVSVIEPGSVATELSSHVRPEAMEAIAAQFEGSEALEAIDVAEAISFVVTRDKRSHLSEIVIRPTISA